MISHILYMLYIIVKVFYILGISFLVQRIVCLGGQLLLFLMP